MTYQEAIKELKLINLKSVHPFLSWEEMKDIRDMAIEALEKQMPMKPIHKHLNYYCPICGDDGLVTWDDAEPNDFDSYCCKCGQALDWSDTDA